jgi:phosphatidate cytidylyltransferase
MARPVDNSRLANVRVRVFAGVPMALLGVVVIVAGGYIFSLAILVLSVLMIWEWNGLCLDGAPKLGAIVISAVGVTVGVAAIVGLPTALATLAVLVPSTWLLVRTFGGRSSWAAFGVVYVSVPCLAVIWLRATSPLGFETVIWLVMVVCATDIGAYFAGTMIGGPKLAPTISPNKTWSGLLGGILCAAAVGAVTGLVLGLVNILLLSVIGAVVAAVAQSGDFFESFVKRRFDASDSSQLIPGHGGVLDRVDGLLAVLPLAAGAKLLLVGGSFWPWR